MTATYRSVISGIVLMVPEAGDIAPHAHITLLAPFGRDSRPTEGELADVAAFFADVTPFDFRLEGESRFPDGTRYLCPEPAATFSRLTHRLHRLFPEYPPYEGEFDLVVPHLTVPDDAATPPRPITGRATEAALLHFAGAFRILRRFPFGTSAA